MHKTFLRTTPRDREVALMGPRIHMHISVLYGRKEKQQNRFLEENHSIMGKIMAWNSHLFMNFKMSKPTLEKFLNQVFKTQSIIACCIPLCSLVDSQIPRTML